MTANEQLDDIQARANAATAGPWRLGSSRRDVEVRTSDGLFVAEFGTYGLNGSDIDAAFVAAAREDVPALVNALRAVLALHVDDGDGYSWCGGCSDVMPCPTVRAIEEALS